MRFARNAMFLAMVCIMLATGAVTRAYEFYNGPCYFDPNCDCMEDNATEGGEAGHVWFWCHYEDCGAETCGSAQDYCRQACGPVGLAEFLCDQGGCYGECVCWPIPVR